MQFPVPQFTDVEDKIFGPLSIKQFGIVFGAGVIVFMGYSATKSLIVTIIFFILFGLPALALAFVKPNGRPAYNSIGSLINFYTSPKQLIFHKEAQTGGGTQKTMKDAQMAQTQSSVAAPVVNTRENLKEVEELLKKTSSEETNVAGKIR